MDREENVGKAQNRDHLNDDVDRRERTKRRGGGFETERQRVCVYVRAREREIV